MTSIVVGGGAHDGKLPIMVVMGCHQSWWMMVVIVVR
jgi:hypothetical protein